MITLDALEVKSKEAEVLADSVRLENHRIHALSEQKRYALSYSIASLMTRKYSGATGIIDAPADGEKNCEGLDWDLIAEKVSAQLLGTFFGYCPYQVSRACSITTLL